MCTEAREYPVALVQADIASAMATQRRDSVSSEGDENPFVHEDDDDWAALSDNVPKDAELDLTWAEEDVQDEVPTSSEAVVVSAPMSENSAERVLEQHTDKTEGQLESEEHEVPPARVLSGTVERQQDPAPKQEAPVQIATPIVVPAPSNTTATDTVLTHAPAAQPAMVLTSSATPTPGGMQESAQQEPNEIKIVQQHVQTQPYDAGSSRAGGWGWNSTWGLGALKNLAAGAVRDVKELTGSLQQALAEVEDESADEEEHQVPAASDNNSRREASENAHQSQSHGATKQASSTALQQAATAGKVPTAASAGPPAPLVADREPGEETNPELEDVDQQVELLTAGAAKALSSLWGGLSGVARNTAHLVSKVEAVTLDLAKDLVSGAGVSQDVAQLQAVAAQGVRGVTVNVGRFGLRLEAGLESVGRTAMGLLEEVTGQHAPSGKGRAAGSRDGTHPEGLAGSKSFDDLFDLYGGHQVAEQLEVLANECARIANRARARLEVSQQAELDEVLALLGPIFSQSLASPSAPPHSTSGALAAPGSKEEEALQAAQEQLEQRYVPVRFLCQDSLARAHAFKTMLLEALKGATAEHATATSTPPAQPAGDQAPHTPAAAPGSPHATGGAVQDADGWDMDEAALNDSAVGGTEDEQPASGVAAVHAALLQLQAHALKRLAELVTAELQLLVDNGSNLAAPARSSQVQVGSISWPPKARQQAQLLRAQAKQMVQDMMTVGSAYAEAIQALLELLQTVNTLHTPACDAADDGTQDGTTGTMAATTEQDTQTVAVNEPAGISLSAPGGQATQEAGTVSWGSTQQLCQQVQQEVLAAHKTAVGRVEEGFRGLLYAVLVRVLVQQIAGGPAAQLERQ